MFTCVPLMMHCNIYMHSMECCLWIKAFVMRFVYICMNWNRTPLKREFNCTSVKETTHPTFSLRLLLWYLCEGRGRPSYVVQPLTAVVRMWNSICFAWVTSRFVLIVCVFKWLSVLVSCRGSCLCDCWTCVSGGAPEPAWPRVSIPKLVSSLSFVFSLLCNACNIAVFKFIWTCPYSPSVPQTLHISFISLYIYK